MLKRNIFKRRVNVISLLAWILALNIIYGHSFKETTPYQVYFTPRDNCTTEITRTIYRAQKSIYVQAYFLTSEPILDALVMAKSKGVDVSVILDKRHPENQKGIKQLLQAQIPIWIDQVSGIAHNKVMIVDEQIVITGSFNFTYSANHRNRENLLLIEDKGIARHYLDNWHYCKIKAVQEKPVKVKKSKVAANDQVIENLTKLITVIVIGIASALGIKLK